MTTIEIKSDITGTVCQIVASAGDRLQEGDTVLMIESMKMEIPVLASSPGVLDRICVAAGATVNEGDVLAVIES